MSNLLGQRRLCGIGAELEIDEERMDWYERIKEIREDARGAIEKGFADRGFDKATLCGLDVPYCKSKGTGNDGICDSGRSFGGDSDTCNNDLQAEDRGTLECDNLGNPRSLRGFFRRGRNADAWFKRALTGKANEGQSTVEYALISVAFLSIVLGIGVLSDLLTNGAVVSHAVNAASHGTANIIGGAADVFGF